ncbi:hypothetical protein ACFQ60_20270 [Streptomyces zhihengii]
MAGSTGAVRPGGSARCVPGGRDAALPPPPCGPAPGGAARARSAATWVAAAATTLAAGAPRSRGARWVATRVPARSRRTAVSSSRSRWSPTAYPAEGTSRSTVRGLPPVEARRPASAAMPSARSRATILLTACGVSPVPSASSIRLMPASPRRAAGRARAPRCGCAARAG